jgi:hypothetical protein
MQGGLEVAEAIDRGLRAGDLSSRIFAEYERLVRKRYHHFRRFAVGFYDPAFRELWFTRPQRLTGVYRAVVSVLAGNWRPSLTTRARIVVFFAAVGVRRAFLRLRRARPA